MERKNIVIAVQAVAILLLLLMLLVNSPLVGMTTYAEEDNSTDAGDDEIHCSCTNGTATGDPCDWDESASHSVAGMK